MTTINDTTTASDGRRSQATSSNGRAELTAGSTEARPGIITTEFWLALLGAAAVVIVSYVDDALDVDQGWMLGIGLLAAYVISRGIAKAGSSERYIDIRERS
jgi:hypothetical protein